MLQEFLYRIKRPFHFLKTGLLLGWRAERAFDFPAKKLNIIAITGTDGKTSSSTMLYYVLKAAGKRVALLSTVAAYIDDQTIDTGFHVTSPDPWKLHEILRKMVDKGIEYVVIEITSHGSYQYRNWGIHPLIAGVTNITREHLDYHVTYDNYVEAKSWILESAQLAIINEDDQSFKPLRRRLEEKNKLIETYGTDQRMDYKIIQTIKKRFPELYNQSNARLVATIARRLEIPIKSICEGLLAFPGVPGRMEVVATKPFTVIVDFAHTPNALENALQALQKKMAGQKKKGSLIAIYGSAGLRDRAKRPLMGQAGVTYADQVILTAEDPRTENVWSIIRQMKEQLTEGHHKVISIADRREAIAFALTQLAKPGDIVGIFGKGHEQSMCYGTTEYPWDDRVAVREILNQK